MTESPTNPASSNPAEVTSGETVLDLRNENLETLRGGGELGYMFAGLYKAALEEDPRLAAVKIWAISPETPGFKFLEHTGGAARHKDDGETSRYELIMNTTGGAAHFQRLLTTRRASAEISAKKVGIEQGRMTPEQLAAFIFLHELGHIVDFMDNAPDKATHDERRNRDLAALPIPNQDPTKLAMVMETPDGKKWFFKNLKALNSNFGVESFNDLLRIQEEAYHDMETEDIPDQFAARVMKKLALV